jgi:hypothetical protein
LIRTPIFEAAQRKQRGQQVRLGCAAPYVMYLSTKLPIALKALFKPLASEFIPAVAANATKARIRQYSTKPWPDSSFCRRAREHKTKVFIDLLLRFLLWIQRFGAAMGHSQTGISNFVHFLNATFVVFLPTGGTWLEMNRYMK